MSADNLRPLIIVGAGGHGREVLWLAQNINKVAPTYDILGYCDDNRSLVGTEFSGMPILGTPEQVDAEIGKKPFFTIGIGDNSTRKKIAERIEGLGWQAETLIDPSAIVADSASIGAGAYVGVVSNISPTAVIGRHTIVHNQSSVGHDTIMADYSQVSPGGRVLGHVSIGECGYVGSNAVVCPLKNVGAHAVLGACSFAISDIPDHSVALGVPARLKIKPKSEIEGQLK